MEIKELKKFLKHNYGYITTKEFKNSGIPKTSIPELLNQNIMKLSNVYVK